MRNTLTALVTFSLLTVSAAPSLAGTATNYSEWGTNRTRTNRVEHGKFDRKSDFEFEYSRHGNGYESVLKNEFSADGDILSGYLKGGKRLGKFFNIKGGLVGTTANDFEAIGISTYTEDDYSYDLVMEGSSSSHESGTFELVDHSLTDTEWDLHEVSAGTAGSDFGL